MAAPAQDTDFGIAWPPGWSMGAKHLYCAFNNVGKGSFYHRKEIISTLWPGDAYVWHPWNERRLRSVCDCNWNTWAGPGGSAKTVDAAVFGIEFWLECPEATAVIVCSTTMKMLRKRIWSQVASYHQRLPKALKAGELIDSDTMIRWKKGDARNGIFGMAVEERAFGWADKSVRAHITSG